MREYFSGKLTMADFPELFQMLRSAASCGFETLVESAKIVDRLVKPVNVPGEVTYRPLDIDFESSELIPTEYFGEFVALNSRGDGNCCFRAASILFFGSEERHLEIRVRTIIELALHSFFYLADEDVISRMEAEMAIIQGKQTPGSVAF